MICIAIAATQRAVSHALMATKTDTPPACVSGGDFKEVPGNYLWRDDELLLVPAQLLVHEAKPGEKIHLRWASGMRLC